MAVFNKEINISRHFFSILAIQWMLNALFNCQNKHEYLFLKSFSFQYNCVSLLINVTA